MMNKDNINENENVESKDVFRQWYQYISQLVNLDEDKADPIQSIREIEKSVVFKGTNVWILMFSILVASLGLNTNSTAVIIGAMLISPLLGPIMGVGLGIGINSFDLIKKSLSNLAVMVVISIVTSALYFLLTPLKETQSELLARTQPAIWDVGIAFFGGLAGIVALSRKEKSNVIPGVAIATALMPPLCTAGYGLGTGQWNFFLGAFYLFFINSVFICLATVIIVRYLKYPQKVFVDKQREKKVKTYIAVVVVLTILPSIYLAYNIVAKSIFERNARSFIANNFNGFDNTKVIYPVIEFHPRDSSLIEITLIGDPLDEEVLEFVSKRLPEYGLLKTRLIINQGGGMGATLEKTLLENINQNLRSGILEEVYRKRELELENITRQRDSLIALTKKIQGSGSESKDISNEIAIQYPGIQTFSISYNLKSRPGNAKVDTSFIALVQIDRNVFKNRNQFEEWLKVRTKQKALEFIYY